MDMDKKEYEAIATMLTCSSRAAITMINELSKELCEFPELTFGPLIEFLVKAQDEPEACECIQIRRPEHRAIGDIIENSDLRRYLSFERIDDERSQICFLGHIPNSERIGLGRFLTSRMRGGLSGKFD